MVKEHVLNYMAVFLFFLFATTYYFSIPEHIDTKQNPNSTTNNTSPTHPHHNDNNIILDETDSSSKLSLKSLYNMKGYWGQIDAEFDWCEYNYRWSHFIAEPLNVITSLVMCVWGIWGMLHYKKYGSMLQDLVICCSLTVILGLGSALFHGSLRYSMQLLDELPMYYCSTYCLFLYYYRSSTSQDVAVRSNDNGNSDNNDNRNGFCISKETGLWIVTIWNIIISIWLIATEKEGNEWEIYLHNIGRGIWTISFGMSLVGLYLSVVRTSKECNLAHIGLRNPLCFGIGAACWFTDNFFCDKLQSLPLGLPYLHLHAFGWHICVALAIHYWFIVLVLHRMIVINGYKHEQLEFKKMLGGTIFYVDIKDWSTKIKDV